MHGCGVCPESPKHARLACQRCHPNLQQIDSARGGAMARRIDGWLALCVMGLGTAAAGSGAGADAAADSTMNMGPYNLAILEGGIGMTRPLSAQASLRAAGAPWSITGWVRTARRRPGEAIVAAVGNTTGADPDADWRGLLLLDGAPAVKLAPSVTLTGGGALEP